MSLSRVPRKRPAGRSPEGEYADGRSEPVPTWRSPTLATLTDERFSDPDWIFERKLDGVRCLAFRNGRKVRLLSRNRQSLNGTYPEVVDALAAQKCSKFVVDGEIVAFEGRRTSFARLQGRLGITDPEHALASGIAVFYYLFDLIHLDGRMTTDLPLIGVNDCCATRLNSTDPLRYTTHRVRDGEAAFDAACERGDEGVIAKLADAPYERAALLELVEVQVQPRPGVRHRRLHRPEGQPGRTWRALLGYHDGDELAYAGKVGTGFDTATLQSLHKRLSRTEQDSPPVTRGRVSEPGAHWVRPTSVAQVAFSEWTRDGKLRHPRYLGLRTDKSPDEVVRESR